MHKATEIRLLPPGFFREFPLRFGRLREADRNEVSEIVAQPMRVVKLLLLILESLEPFAEGLLLWQCQ